MSSANIELAATPSPTKERNAYIDNLRGWSIFGVVCVHFAGSFVNSDNAWSPSFYLGLTLNQIFSFAVPLFVFLSGYLAGLSRKGTVSLWSYYQGRFWRIGFPYFIASIAAFFLLNHFTTWKNLPDKAARTEWVFEKLFYYGVEPTLYFIPLIILLYILQPLLKALPAWIHSIVPSQLKKHLTFEHTVLALTFLFLVAHIILGIKCYQGSLNYYDWGRPNPLFWAVYFFSGLHFKSLTSFISTRGFVIIASIAGVTALSAMTWNGLHLLDWEIVGSNFEHNNLDYAYVRPAILIFDLAMVACLSCGIALGWKWRTGIASFLGRYTLEIYLWHILLLYYGAWSHANALSACREIPELIVIICATTCFLIAGVAHWVPRLTKLVKHYRPALIEVK